MIDGIASDGTIWLASSKMTTSNSRAAGSTWLTISGDMAQHGLTANSTSPAWSSSRRSGRWPRRSAACLRMTRACSGCRSSASRAARAQVRRTRDRFAARCSTSRCRKSSAISSSAPPRSAAYRGSRTRIWSRIEVYQAWSKAAAAWSPCRLLAGQLVEQRSAGPSGRTAGQLVQPGQLPRCLLVGGQRPDHGLGRIRRSSAGTKARSAASWLLGLRVQADQAA